MPMSRAAAISAESKSPPPRGCKYRWSDDVVHPAIANSAKPTQADTCADSSLSMLHNGYKVRNQPNNAESVIGP